MTELVLTEKLENNIALVRLNRPDALNALNIEHEQRMTLNSERITFWLGQGAKPTDRVHKMLAAAGLAEAPVIRDQPKKSAPGKKRAEREAEAASAAEAAAESAAAEAAAAEEAAAAASAEEAPAEEAPAEEAVAEEAPADEVAAEEKADSE